MEGGRARRKARSTSRLDYRSNRTLSSRPPTLLLPGRCHILVLLRTVGAANMLEIGAIACGVVVGGVDPPRGEILPWDVGVNIGAVLISRHDAVSALSHQAHDQVGI